MVGGDIKKVGKTLPISDPDGVVDLVKVCKCVKRKSNTFVAFFVLYLSRECRGCFPGKHRHKNSQVLVAWCSTVRMHAISCTHEAQRVHRVGGFCGVLQAKRVRSELSFFSRNTALHSRRAAGRAVSTGVYLCAWSVTPRRRACTARGADGST